MIELLQIKQYKLNQQILIPSLKNNGSTGLII